MKDHSIMISQSTKRKIQKIQDIIGQDDGDRGMKALIVPDDLEQAAIHITSLLSSSETTTNEEDSINIKQHHVLVLSGFPCCVNDRPPTETDGPPGAIAIAKCVLALGRNVHVTIITDDCNRVVFEAAIGNNGNLHKTKTNTIHLETFPADSNMKDEDHNRLKVIAEERCDLIIACERAGPGIDGKCYTMRGIDMNAKGLIAPIHRIVDIARNREKNLQQKTAKFIAIGDGGNELGMGKVIDRIRTSPKIPNGDLIGAVTSADYLISASVSNWGGYALAGACALVKSDIDKGKNLNYWLEICVPELQHEINLLERCVRVGCRDGVTGKMETTVDGMPLKTSLDCLQNIINVCQDDV